MGDNMTDTLTITADGKLSINDYRSIYKAILIVLAKKPMKMLELVNTIRNEFTEFKFIKIQIIANALGDLMKRHLVVSYYGEM